MSDSMDNAKTQIIQWTGHHDCTMDSGRALVPRDPGQSNQVEVATQLRDSKYWTAELRRLDRLQFLKQAQSHVHGETISDSLVLAYRGSTNRQAQRKFQTWLPAEIESVTRDTVLHFLIYLESELKLGARTIVNYRGCLALPLRTAFHIDFNHECFSLLTRSLFLQNPPIRKKIPSWSLDAALETFTTQRFGLPHAEKTDRFLKTLFLVVLASGNRASELAATRREGVGITGDKLVLPVIHLSCLRHNLLPDLLPHQFPSPSWGI